MRHWSERSPEEAADAPGELARCPHRYSIVATGEPHFDLSLYPMEEI